MKEDYVKNLAILWSLSIILALVTDIRPTSAKEPEDDYTRKGVIAGCAATGGWLGSGIGYTATKKVAEVLYKKESEGIIATVNSLAQINDFVKNHGSTGKFLGVAVGTGVAGYLAKKAFDDSESYWQSWKKLGSSIQNWDSSKLDKEDVKIYVGNIFVMSILGWAIYDLSK